MTVESLLVQEHLNCDADCGGDNNTCSEQGVVSHSTPLLSRCYKLCEVLRYRKWGILKSAYSFLKLLFLAFQGRKIGLKLLHRLRAVLCNISKLNEHGVHFTRGPLQAFC